MISRSMGPRTKNCVDPTLRRSEEGWFLHCYDEMLLLSGWVSVNLHCFSLSSDILWICKIAYYWFITFLYLNGPGGKVRMRCIQLYGKLHKQKHAQRVQNKIALRKMAINKNKRKSVHRTQVSISQKKKENTTLPTVIATAEELVGRSKILTTTRPYRQTQIGGIVQRQWGVRIILQWF